MTRLRLTKVSGYGLAAVFAAVGVVFLAIPGKVLAAFNRMAEGMGWAVSPTDAHTLYLVLAVAYMYLVTLLAVQMARYPDSRIFSRLLWQAKAASSILSLGLFVFQERYLLYLANFAVDGAIALYVASLSRRTKAVPERAEGS